VPEPPTGSYDATGTVVGLARTLRSAGVDASPDRVQTMVTALAVLDPAQRGDVYWAGRLSLCATHDDIEVYDRVFAAYFGDRPVRAGTTLPSRVQLRVVTGTEPGEAPPADEEGDDAAALAALASRAEVLRHRDIATLSPQERAELNAVLAAFRLPGDLRRSRRLVPAQRGRVDPARTVRQLLRSGGEPALLRYRARRERPRRIVLLVDVSGSMAPYADALLRFAHAALRGSGVPAEIFTIGTRLTRVTRQLAHRDPDVAMAEVAREVPDWHGGTRLGDLVKEFLDRWGQRGTARGAVVVVLSDGLERGDATQLGTQMARLSRLAHRVVWANPLKGHQDYAPLAAGMAAALPHIDNFVAGHSVTALERLAAVVSGAERG
jgi:uncharacterized protein with von Willebrand factor type A (vWA) domain